jgi:hypothetical protein
MAATSSSDQIIVKKNQAAAEKLRKMGLPLNPKGTWKQGFGSMKDCEHFDEAIRLGAQWRDARACT